MNNHDKFVGYMPEKTGSKIQFFIIDINCTCHPQSGRAKTMEFCTKSLIHFPKIHKPCILMSYKYKYNYIISPLLYSAKSFPKLETLSGNWRNRFSWNVKSSLMVLLLIPGIVLFFIPACCQWVWFKPILIDREKEFLKL